MRTYDGAQLSARQIEILAAYGRAGGIKDAAAQLRLRPQTMKNLLSDIYAALEVPGGVAAIWTVFVPDEE